MIMDNNKPALWDGRLPCFWIKRVASMSNQHYLENSGQVVRVTITLDKPKKK